VVHRDIKPANILLDKRLTSPGKRKPMGEPILTDFGIARLQGPSTLISSRLGLGTPLYISPEQAQGQPGDECSDLYSLGVIVYEMLTGVTPFRGENPFTVLMQHYNASPPLPESINPNISPALSSVILRSLAKDPYERFPSASAMTITLAEALDVPVPVELNQQFSSTNSAEFHPSVEGRK
jgi:serine/threonine protein kinase